MIILLNGTSSAGKTTIARSMQARHDGILLLYGVDAMVQLAFPAKCDEALREDRGGGPAGRR